MKISQILLTVAAVCCVSVQAKTILKFAHVGPASDTQQAAAELFAQKVAQYSQGDLEVQIFGAGVLGNDQQLISSVRSGTLDFVLVGNPNYTGLEPKLGVFDLPFMFANRAQAYKVLDGKTGKEALSMLSAKGLKGVSFWEVGFRAMTNNVHPIKKPDDVKGLKMRTNSNKQLIEYFQLLGANTVPMPLNELYTALETKIVDAQDHPIGIVWSAKLYEVQKFLSMTNQAYTALILAMNQKKFNKLSAVNQQAILRAGQDGAQLQRKLNLDNEQKILQALQDKGVTIEAAVDVAAFQQLAPQVWKSYIKNNGQEWIDKVVNASAASDK